MKINRYNAIVVYGPTASGKSGFGVELAKKINGVIINCDSTQIYKELPIITAQPTKTEMQNIPHYLYGILDQNIKINTILWLEYLTKTLEKIDKNKTPIILGGTGLYVSTLLNNGLNYIPQISDKTKQLVQNILHNEGIEYIITKLKESDIDTFNRISKNDTQRLLRYFEVLIETGHSISFWWNQPKKNTNYIGHNFLKIYINPEREVVYKKCKDRFYEMIKMGAIDEVEEFIKKYPDIYETQMSKIIGLTELKSVIENTSNINTSAENAIQRTRHYAKRQFTWFNNKIAHDLIIKNVSQTDSEIEKIKNLLN